MSVTKRRIQSEATWMKHMIMSMHVEGVDRCSVTTRLS